MAKILIACEESQRVCTEFRKRGHEAYSCDILPCSGGHPGWHIQGDVIPLLNGDCDFWSVDVDRRGVGWHKIVGKWDLIIAHPPCTYLSNVATRHHSLNCSPVDKINARTMKRIESMNFFMKFVTADCEHIAVENPVGVMNTCYRKPDMIIHPYMFAESVDDTDNYCTKATCLWLKGLPELVGNGIPKPDNEKIYGRNPNGKVSNWEERQIGGKDRSKNRSKTFSGIAKAMAEQWGGIL